MKIIFLVYYQFFYRDYIRYGIKFMVQQGYDVEIWRMMDKTSVNLAINHNIYKGSNYYEFDLKHFKKQLKKNSNAIFMLQRSRDIYSLEIAKRGLKYIVSDGFGAVIQKPDDLSYNQDNKSLINTIKKIFRLGLVGSVKQGIVHINYLHSIDIGDKYIRELEFNAPLAVVTSTKLGAERYLSREELRCNVLYTHTWDYDRYIETERNTTEKKIPKHILYCDSGDLNLTYDAMLTGQVFDTVQHNREIFEKLEILFKKLETTYGLPVVIAGHPHTQYKKGAFNGRQIIFNKTCELTKYAAVFVTTTTTAQSFAALYDVPILKVVCKYMKNTHIGTMNRYDYIMYETDVIGCGVIDLDDEIQMENLSGNIKQWDQQKRRKYIVDYIIDNDTTEKTIIEYTEEFIKGLK